MSKWTLAPVLWLAITACDGGDSGNNNNGEEAAATQGNAKYRDASTNSGGDAVAPESPPAQDGMQVSLELEGSGLLSGLDADCADPDTGSVNGLYEGEGEIDENGAYTSSLAMVDLTTPSGCTLDDLSLDVVTGVTFHAELTNTQENCTTYCDAYARAYAEDECSLDLDQASCRSELEADASASCETECTTSQNVIVAEVELGATALTDLSADSLEGSALGTIDLDLTFDHLEDGDGNDVDVN